MPWYKIELNYGPGHQSHDVEYEHSSEVLSKEAEREMVEGVIDRVPWIRDSDNSVCWECNAITKLPDDIRTSKEKYYKAVLKGAESMLKLLNDGK